MKTAYEEVADQAIKLIDFRHLELPEPTDFVSGKTFAVNPLVNRVGIDAQMGGNLITREPSFRMHDCGHSCEIRCIEHGVKL